MGKKLGILIIVFALGSCSSSGTDNAFELDTTLLAQYFSIDFEDLSNYASPNYPAHYNDRVFDNFDNERSTNRVTDEGATLGRVLFFDPSLSRNDTTSCASCHDPAKAFSDENRFSEGFLGDEFTSAHSMRLLNARFYPDASAFWDKRAATLEDQATEPIKNEIEMGFDDANGGIEALITKMQDIEYYPHLFEWVFGDDEITEERMQQAIAQFVRSIVSYNSKFDDGYAQVFDPNSTDGNINAAFPNFTDEENEGKSIFMRRISEGGASCNHCHRAPTFGIAFDTRGIGLDPGNETVFKAPSLKGVAENGPYMHDGRFDTLEEVIDHYDSGIVFNGALDRELENMGTPVTLGLSVDDKAALKAFLETLSDDSIETNPKYQNPFSN